MKVKELIEWLSAFEDQEAEVTVLSHNSNGGYYEQGGTAWEVSFDPDKHTDYTDFRNNPFVKPHSEYYGARFLFLGYKE